MILSPRKSSDHLGIYTSWNLLILFVKEVIVWREGKDFLRNNIKKLCSVGAIVVQGNRIVSTGYNGTPGPLTNCFEGGCERCNTNKSQGVDLDKCNCIHAEENSILECGKNWDFLWILSFFFRCA